MFGLPLICNVRAIRNGVGLALCLCAVACGGGGGGSSGTTPIPTPTPTSNVATATVDQGPSGNSVNTLFVSVTLCVPGSSTNCQVIDHVSVDTGSYGLRILAPVLSLSLPAQLAASGNPLAECVTFGDGYAWGPVEVADVQIAGESAKALPVHAIGDARYTTVPADCSATNATQEDTVATFGSNGILGIGPYKSDCPDCANKVYAGTYYSCAAPSTCVGTIAALDVQVPNPVPFFATDNNGTIIELPSVPNQGQQTVTGSLFFGVDTQSNNASGTQTVLTVDDNANLVMIYNGQNLSQSFIDSGSNAIYFTDDTIAQCQSAGLMGFYCPGNSLSLGLSIQGQNGVMANNLTFIVGNAQTLLNANPTFNAQPLLGGTNSMAQSFDYGLAFYYGRRVATVIEGNKTAVGTGPYVAF